MEDNSPNCIATNVISALNYPNIEGITKNACAYVRTESTYEAVVEKYRIIIE